MKELKIGEKVTITFEAVEQTSCVGCCFNDGGTCLNPTINWDIGGLQCCSGNRSDGKDVIFKLVNV